MGNPPFVGAKLMSDAQREDTRVIFHEFKNGGLLDYVSAWYVKAMSYLKGNPFARRGWLAARHVV